MISLLMILLSLTISCTNQNREKPSSNNEADGIEQNETPNPDPYESSINKNLTIGQLQGKWKEIEYPYRSAEFVNSTVKFIEEGTSGDPAFEVFEISENCLYDNNNIRDLSTGDIILTVPETTRCEKLKVENDTYPQWFFNQFE
ncbi:MAG: hypothetical protein IPI60_09890 [Saprospiraceae bacterium]|nr:hypothetical protein [Saprospiraceae bacterium]